MTKADEHENAMQALMLGDDEVRKELFRLRDALGTILANLPTTTQCQCQGEGGCVSCMVRKIIHRAGFFAPAAPAGKVGGE